MVALQALRGFSALYVVIFHAKTLWAGGTEYLRHFPVSMWRMFDFIIFVPEILTSAGYEMVIVFFVLSGFFIRHALLSRPRTLFAFYANRIARIYPPYVASLIFSGLIIYYIANDHAEVLRADIGRELNAGLLAGWESLRNLSGFDAIRVLLFMPVREGLYFSYNLVYWSLLPEMLFYVIAPVAFQRLRVYLIVSLVLYGLRCVAVLFHYTAASVLLPYNIYFVAGVVLYDFLARSPAWLERARGLSRRSLAVSLGALFIVVVALAQLRARVYGHLLSEFASAVFAVVCIVALVSGRIRQGRILRSLENVGQFSFSLYLFHLPILFVVYCFIVRQTGLLVNYQRYYLASIPVAFFGSLALYWVTERASLRAFSKLRAGA